MLETKIDKYHAHRARTNVVYAHVFTYCWALTSLTSQKKNRRKMKKIIANNMSVNGLNQQTEITGEKEKKTKQFQN
jgi:hypothetical protein